MAKNLKRGSCAYQARAFGREIAIISKALALALAIGGGITVIAWLIFLGTTRG